MLHLAFLSRIPLHLAISANKCQSVTPIFQSILLHLQTIFSGLYLPSTYNLVLYLDLLLLPFDRIDRWRISEGSPPKETWQDLGSLRLNLVHLDTKLMRAYYFKSKYSKILFLWPNRPSINQ